MGFNRLLSKRAPVVAIQPCSSLRWFNMSVRMLGHGRIPPRRWPSTWIDSRAIPSSEPGLDPIFPVGPGADLRPAFRSSSRCLRLFPQRGPAPLRRARRAHGLETTLWDVPPKGSEPWPPVGVVAPKCVIGTPMINRRARVPACEAASRLFAHSSTRAELVSSTERTP